MSYLLSLALVLVAFLVVLNGFLRGAKKGQIDAVLSLLLVGLATSAFIIGGWKLGFLAIAIALIAAIVTRPIAARLAARLFAASTGGGGGYVGLPPRSLPSISQQLGQPTDPNNLMEEILSGGGRKAAAENALLDYCEQQPAIKLLLKESKVSRHDLQELYHQLVSVGAGQWAGGHWVAASAWAYPESLRYVLGRRG